VEIGLSREGYFTSDYYSIQQFAQLVSNLQNLHSVSITCQYSNLRGGGITFAIVELK